jgi:hypothetical protein
MLALEARRDRVEVAKCADEETCADQQLNRKSEFDDHDGFAGPKSRCPPAVRSLVIEVGVGCGSRGTPCRGQAEEQGRQEGNRESETEYAMVGSDIQQHRGLALGQHADQQAAAPYGKKKAENSSGK